MDQAERSCNSATEREVIPKEPAAAAGVLSVLEEKGPPKGFAKRKNGKSTAVKAPT